MQYIIKVDRLVFNKHISNVHKVDMPTVNNASIPAILNVLIISFADC